MVEIFDIMLDQNFDLKIENGDFAFGESTQQHQQCILLSEPGSYKQTISLGVGLFSYMNNDESLESLKKEIQKNFESDGMKISELTINSTTDIKVTANY